MHQQAESTAKHVADGLAAVSGLGSFSAVVLNWLEGASLILAIIASLMSIAWLATRFYDRWKGN